MRGGGCIGVLKYTICCSRFSASLSSPLLAPAPHSHPAPSSSSRYASPSPLLSLLILFRQLSNVQGVCLSPVLTLRSVCVFLCIAADRRSASSHEVPTHHRSLDPFFLSNFCCTYRLCSHDCRVLWVFCDYLVDVVSRSALFWEYSVSFTHNNFICVRKDKSSYMMREVVKNYGIRLTRGWWLDHSRCSSWIMIQMCTSLPC